MLSGTEQKRAHKYPALFAKTWSGRVAKQETTTFATSAPFQSNTQNKPQPWCLPHPDLRMETRGGIPHPTLLGRGNALPQGKAWRPGLPSLSPCSAVTRQHGLPANGSAAAQTADEALLSRQAYAPHTSPQCSNCRGGGAWLSSSLCKNKVAYLFPPFFHRQPHSVVTRQ